MSRKTTSLGPLDRPIGVIALDREATPYAERFTSVRTGLTWIRVGAQMGLIRSAMLGVIMIGLSTGCDGQGAEDACKELSQARMEETCKAHNSNHALCKGSPVYAMRLQELTEECKNHPSPTQAR
ncbi:hypothetical protein MK280_17665 [Myxococcota bacterium]|nr:hypothetical protein [Myxococcota bacterium]